MSQPTTTAPIEMTPDEQLDVLKTWRYLRMALAGLAIAIFAAIAEDRIRGHHDASATGAIAHCLQGSISAYYYTPVHALLIGALVAIGVSLYCIRGDTPAEDALLNIAGMCAPVVAFVPTDPPGRCISSAVQLDRANLAATSMFALAALETLALAFVYWLATRTPRPEEMDLPGPKLADRIGYVVAAAIVVLEWVLWAFFLAGHNPYTKVVHFSAAGLMFGCIFLVVWIRAATESQRGMLHLRLRHRDTWLTLLMVGSLIAFAILNWGVHWPYAVFQIEVCLIGLFMVYWFGQTIRGWHPGFGVAKKTPPASVARLSAP